MNSLNSFALKKTSQCMSSSMLCVAPGYGRVNRIAAVHSGYMRRDRPPALRALFVRRSQVSARETRSTAAGELQLAKCRLSATQRTFSYRAARAWNALPPAVTAAQIRRELMRAVNMPDVDCRLALNRITQMCPFLFAFMLSSMFHLNLFHLSIYFCTGLVIPTPWMMPNK